MNAIKTERQTPAKPTQILEAAATIFAERGFHAATTKDIARAAGVAEGTLYNHFANKSALLLGVMDLMRERLPPPVPPPSLRGLPLSALIRLHLQAPLAAFSANNGELMRVILSELPINAELRGLFARQVQAPMLAGSEELFRSWAVQNGVVLDGLEVKMRAIFGLILGLLLQRFMEDAVLEARWDALPDLLTGLLAPGFAGADAGEPT